ncbi:hypothetical protein K505DRAFT_417118 [Melanomma pulvis-pyrius CBS 109.77]|uniref:Lytic polysaccharide monooxygenase n=1 Tax=Melanomma pulvis-pyrius CBS 109.77 TaxID=1314802 RepID=A0A6A6XD89_9PLEO|nr:hypothetical protein K505DRAFT_417118 [Melanomma pulvis-pyrius CBS 109.77]
MRAISLLPSSPCLAHLLFIFRLFSLFPLGLSQESTQPSPIEQKILHPARDDVLEAGGIFTIQWTADPHFANVTLEVWDKTSWGYSRDFGTLCYHWINPFCGTIVSHAPNTGSYQWHIPKPGSDFPRKQRVFWIKMYVDDYLHPEIGNKDPVLSYSSNFCFAPEPGQDAGVGESSTTALASSAMPDVQQQGTVFVTVHDTATTYIGATTRPFNASATATGAPNRNITDSAPIHGAAPRMRQTLPTIVLLFLGLF